MLIHVYPLKHQRNVEVTICKHQAHVWSGYFMVLPLWPIFMNDQVSLNNTNPTSIIKKQMWFTYHTRNLWLSKGNCLVFLIASRIIGITHSSCLTVVLKLKLCVIAFLVSYLYWQNYSWECYENTFLLSISGVNLLWPSREMWTMQMGGGSVLTWGTAGLLFPSWKGLFLRPVGYSWGPSSSLFIAGR